MKTEQQLSYDIQNGVDGARTGLYDRYAGYLMAVCMRYVADRESARDVLQDSFLKVFTSISNFHYRGEGSLKAWLTRGTANECINWLRQRNRQFITEQEAGREEAAALRAGFAMEEEEEPDVGSLSMDDLQLLITELPAGYRAVFNMFVFEQRSHKEIAALLGIKENSSASQLLRAKKILARRINELIKHQKT